MLTILIARVKQAARWSWAITALVLGASVAVLYGLFRRRENDLPGPDPIDRALDRYERITAEATARAAVEIAVVRERDQAVRAELMEVLRAADEDEQIERLIAVGKKVRGER